MVDPARHDPFERLKVVVHVHGQPVGRHAGGHPHPDRGDLRVARPHAGEGRVARLGGDALVGQRRHDGALHRVDEVGDPIDLHDRIGHQLAGAVVGHPPAAVGVTHVDPLRAVPVLAHRQVARLGAPALRVHGRVLENEEQVRNLAGLTALAQRLLERHAVPVGHGSKLRHP